MKGWTASVWTASVCGLLQYDYFDDDSLAVIFQKLYFFEKKKEAFFITPLGEVYDNPVS